MLNQKEMTAPNTSVGVDDGQPHVIHNHSITDSPAANKEKMRGDSVNSVSVNELLDHTFEPRPPVIDKLLYPGTYLFVGPPKVGKSFLMLQLGYHVSKGKDLWGYHASQGGVLYLALEDDYFRIQQRMYKMYGAEGTDDFRLSIKVRTLQTGLIDQLEEYLRQRSDTKLIIIDTLQKIRGVQGDQYNYGADYDVITKLKKFSDQHNVCVLVVHHTRKMSSEDSFEMISGTNGIFGAADGAFVITKQKRMDDKAILDITGRDQPNETLTLYFDKGHCIWKCTCKSSEKTVEANVEDPVLKAVADLIRDGNWEGTPTELHNLIGKDFTKPHFLTRYLNVRVNDLLSRYGIRYWQTRTSSSRMIHIGRRTENKSTE